MPDPEVPEIHPTDPNAQQVSAHLGALPVFWNNKPELWFSLVEAKFHLAGITRERTKYNHTLSSLPADIASEVADVITETCTNDPEPYSKLKSAIITRLSLSETQKLRQLLSGLQLGSRKPSQLLRHMISLVGEGKAVKDQVLRELFIQQMPTNLQPILVTLDTVTLQKLAETADKMLETTPAVAISAAKADTRSEAASSFTPSSSVSSDSAMNILIKKIDELINLSRGNEDRSRRQRNRSRNRFKGRSSSRSRTSSSASKQALCWYHHNFGEKANKCVQPCEYSKNALGERN